MTLYEINKLISDTFYSLLDPETGEILGDLSELDTLTIARDEKIENIILMIKNIRAEAEALCNEERKLSARRKTCENRAKSLSKYLQDNLNGEKFKTPRAAVSYRKTQIVNITDLTAIPIDYLRVKDPEPMKDEIKKAIKAGQTVEGAELVDNVSMIIK